MNENRLAQRIRIAENVLNDYKTKEPLSRYLSKYYRDNKQMGSSDRRTTSRYCYNFFRLGFAFDKFSFRERLAIAEFLCETQSDLVELDLAELNPHISDPLSEKINIIERKFGQFLDQVFPFLHELSPAIAEEKFVAAQFVQPNLFLRVKQEKIDTVSRQLDRAGIVFERSGTTFTLKNGQSLQQVMGIEGLYEVQDLSSQHTAEVIEVGEGKQSWWDCCAASGGKSLMLFDRNKNIDLLVSDIRLTILRNLDERFQKAGILPTHYRKKILDLNQSVDHLMSGEQFDNILMDAPCSGSGTWGRTPEMIQGFKNQNITYFSDLQKNIARHAVPYLRTGGQFVYITCSAFSKENEEVTEFICNELKLQKIQQQLLSGYESKADTMFIATFRKY